MTPARIELFIDRLCSFWPTTNIARNTLKSGWVHSDILVDATDEHGKKVLEFCKGLPQFPSLSQIEHMFKQEMGHVNVKLGCEECGGNLWVEAPSIKIDGFTYTQVKRCQCALPDAFKKKGKLDNEIF